MAHSFPTLSKLISLAVTFLPATAFAQAAGSVSGTVTASDTHAPLNGVRVETSSPARIAITDEHGLYVIRDLTPGAYVITATAIGRKPASATIAILTGATATQDFALATGSLMLSSVVVSATRTPVDASKVTATVNVITPEQVRQSAARGAQDLLREVPAVELPRTSSLVGGTAQIVSIRGVDEGRTAVLFDGVPINDAWGEWIDWGRVPKSMLDRVEVVEGGSSSLYGNGAMGGLISFFSRPLGAGDTRLQIDHGSRGASHYYGATGIPLSRTFSASVNADYQGKGGYNLIDPARRGPVDVPSSVIERNGYLRLNYNPSSNLSAYVTGHAFGDSRQLGTPLTFANRDQRNFDVGIDQSNLGGGMLGIRAWDGRQIENQRSSAIRSAALRDVEDSSLTAEIPSHDWGASTQWSRADLVGLESFSFGGDFRHYQGDFNEVDFNTSCPGASCGSVTRRVSSGGEQTLGGAFAQMIASPIEPLRIELSARVDHWSNDNGHSADVAAGTVSYPDKTRNAFSPRLGMRLQLAPSFSIHGAAYKAFRAPNLAELYRKQISATSITVPNPDLAAETALGREAGFDWQPVHWLQAKGTWYVADYHDFNVPVTLTTNKPAACGAIATCRQRLNVNRSRSQGGEAYLAAQVAPEFLLTLGVNYDDARQQSGLPAGTTNAHKPHINRVPSPKQVLRATYSPTGFGEWTVIARHEGRTTTLGGVGLHPYTVVDANVQRELVPGLRGFLSVENVGDVRYEVNIAGAGTAANPFVISNGLPRTIRVGLEAYRF
jgi:outer membrane receptor protein involved in Fe transport